MEKKKSIVFKKITVSILSILFVVCAYLPSVPKVKALSNVTSSNSYGGYTWQIIDTMFDMDGNVTLSSAQISMNLNGHYNGAFIINISLSTIIDSTGIGYTNTINNYGFICNGCIINGYDASHLYVSIYDCNYWEIQIVPVKNASIRNWKAILNALDISSITGWSMTKLDDITATQITTIQNTLTSINSNILTTNSRLTTTNTELHNISNSIGNSSQYGTIQTQLHGIAVNTTSMINEIQDIDDHLSGYLTGTIDNQAVNIWDLQNDANYSLSNIETTLNTINSNINDYTSVLNSISSTLSNIDINLTNIDNTIDTISWTDVSNNCVVGWSKTIDGTYDTTANVTGKLTFIKLDNNIVYNNIVNKLVWFNIPIGSPSVGKYNINYIKIHIRNSSGTIDYVYEPEYYSITNRTYITLYISDIYNYNASYQFIVEVSSDTELYYYNTASKLYKTLPNSDIEYWQLMGYFNQYNSNLRILSAINSISVNITQNDINEMNNNITEYNTTMTDINRIENNYIDNFNTLDNSIDLSNNSTPSVNLIDARTQFNSVFNDITGDLRIRGLLILVLVCGLILILLGA